MQLALNAARRCAPLGRGARFATAAARGLASITGPPAAERDADAVAADVATAREKARRACEAPCADVPLAAGLPETAGRRCVVRPVIAMRSGEPAMARAASGVAWRVTAEPEVDDVNRHRESLMGWTASAVAEASMQPDALEFDRREHGRARQSTEARQQQPRCALGLTARASPRSATAAVEFAARQGWRPEVQPPPALPRCNVASIPGAGTATAGRPVPYAANFDVRRGGIPIWPPEGVDDGAPPPYDVDLEPKAVRD